MFDLLKNLTGIEIISSATIIGAIIGFIIKKTGLRDKITGWLDVLDQKVHSWEPAVVQAGNKTGYNIGVAITTWFNKLPVIGVVYENSLEPLFILFVEGLGKVVVYLASFAVRFIAGCVAFIVTGMRSDNQKFKTARNSEGK